MIRGKRYILINKDELPRWNGDGKGKNGSINYEKKDIISYDFIKFINIL